LRLGYLLFCLSLANAQTPITWPVVRLSFFAAGIQNPTEIAHAGDGSGRLFVAEQAGRIRIVRNGQTLTRPFLDISDRVNCCGERGLLGLAFPPGFADKRRFYVYYTAASGNLTISRFQVSGDPDLADPSSETVLLNIDHHQFENHNGGHLAFGPKDGYLYIGTGDGGGGGDTLESGQNLAALLGKLLRIDVESGVSPYSIPSTNPFVNQKDARPEVWAYGLRNPWRFTFDRANGDLYIGDVGQEDWEEVDYQPGSSGGGENYGWNRMEGNHCFFQEDCSSEGLTMPIAEHSHQEGCSVTGGYVYRGTRFPAMQGFYFYGDYCNGRMWILRFDGAAWQKSPPIETQVGMSTFGEDEAGNLYVADHGEGRIYQIVQDATE
jgi:glucose/arabinose dehydrogenase